MGVQGGRHPSAKVRCDCAPARAVCLDVRSTSPRMRGLVVRHGVIPTALGVNPQHTIMALACHFAERLAGRAGRVRPARTASA